MRRSAKTDTVATPTLVGFATVLVPCGVTLSMELLAITSGSAVAGAAVMAGFVAGTAPLFALLGYLFRHSSQALSGKLAGLTGVVMLTVAAWTMLSALQAGGWVSFDPPSPGRQTSASGPFIVEGGDGSGSGGGGDSQEPPETPETPVRTDASGRQIITLTVTDFYVPTQFTAKAGVPTTLVLHGKDSGGCARAFTIPELGVQEIVKRDGDTDVDLGTRKPDPFNPYERVGIWDLFDVHVVSERVGMAKPDLAIYRLTLDRIGLPAERCVFVDDHAVNLSPAAELGITTVHATDEDAAVAELEALLGVSAVLAACGNLRLIKGGLSALARATAAGCRDDLPVAPAGT